MSETKTLFWLHIKKAGGQTTRRLLQPHYLLVDRDKKPKSFIQASTLEYNDILNNYRTNLGEYQFRRALFAKTFLYPNEWTSMYSFAFCREPLDRCISMYFALYWQHSSTFKSLCHIYLNRKTQKKLILNRQYAFDVFLDMIEMSRHSDSNYHPISKLFTTHTATVWDDASDLNNNLLLTKIYRLEDLIKGINEVFENCGIDQKLIQENTFIRNRTTHSKVLSPTKSHKAKIERLFKRDFELYEKS